MSENKENGESLALRSPDEIDEDALFFDFESILKRIGSFGLYQIGFIFLFQIANISWCSTSAFMSYNAYKPLTSCTYNGTVLVVNSGNATLDSPDKFCAAYEKGLCENLTWTSQFRTVSEEWGLLCSMDFMPQLFNSVQSAGKVVGMLFVGQLCDRFGRKLVFYINFLLLLLFRVIGAVASSPNMFAVCRFLIGMTMMSSVWSNFVYGIELTDKDHNVIIACSDLWQFAFMIVALIGWLTQEWRLYQWVITALSAPLVIGYWFYYESPRWLIQKGKLTRAARNLNWIAKINQKKAVRITKESLTGIRTEERSASSKLGILVLFGNRKIAFYTLVLMFISFATQSAFDSFLFLDSELSGDPFMKFLMYGALRLWIPVTLYLAETRVWHYDRKIVFLLPMSFVFLCFVVISCGFIFAPHNSHFLFYITLMGAVCANCLWVPLGQLSVELFPTIIRGTIGSLIFLAGLLSGVIMPQLVYVQKFWLPLPFVFVSIVIGVSIILALLCLPKTEGKCLPETLEDVE